MALAGTYLALGSVVEHLAAARVEDALGLPARARFPGFRKVGDSIPNVGTLHSCAAVQERCCRAGRSAGTGMWCMPSREPE